jgi:hypothetical protein
LKKIAVAVETTRPCLCPHKRQKDTNKGESFLCKQLIINILNFRKYLSYKKYGKLLKNDADNNL